MGSQVLPLNAVNLLRNSIRQDKATGDVLPAGPSREPDFSRLVPNNNTFGVENHFGGGDSRDSSHPGLEDVRSRRYDVQAGGEKMKDKSKTVLLCA